MDIVVVFFSLSFHLFCFFKRRVYKIF